MKFKILMTAAFLLALSVPAFSAGPPVAPPPEATLFMPDDLYFVTGEWQERRQALLLGDLKAAVELSDDQMAAIDALAVAHRPILVGLFQAIRGIMEDIRDLAQDWQTNFDQICHLEFTLYSREFQLQMLQAKFTRDVSQVLTEAQRPKMPLVMHTLTEAYGLRPPRPQPPEEDAAFLP